MKTERAIEGGCPEDKGGSSAMREESCVVGAEEAGELEATFEGLMVELMVETDRGCRTRRQW
jgi:hypothetical protein